MKTFQLTLAVLIASFGLATGALAQDSGKSSMPKSESATTTSTTTQAGAQKGDRASYRAAKNQADATYKTAKAKCDAMGTASIAKENCIGIARAERNYGRAQAQAQYKPTDKNQRDVKMAAAHLEYANAKAKCEAMGGNVKETGTEASLCMAKANEAKNQALAAAKASQPKGKGADASGKSTVKSATGQNRGDVGQEK